MAFGFFRRRQKMVLIVMAILMVSFLIGFQGFDRLVLRNKDPLVGKMDGTKVHSSQLQRAQSELRSLQLVGLDLNTEYNSVRQGGELAYALLLQEAQNAGIRVADEAVDGFLETQAKTRGMENAQDIYKNLPQGIMKKDLNEAVGHWLMILRNYDANKVNVPPSQTQVRHAYRDVSEQINLRVAAVQAGDFVKEIPAPTDAQVLELFNQFRTTPPGMVASENPFGFGYKQPHKANVQYLVVHENVVQRVTQPTQGQLIAYYGDHKAEYDKDQKDFASVHAEIAQKLSGLSVGSKVQNVVIDAEKIATDIAKTAPAGANIYELAQAKMTLDAKDILDKPLKKVFIDDELEKAVASLAEQAEVDAICYPYDREGSIAISPNVRVRLSAENITLREALTRITEQVTGPQATSAPASAPATAKLDWAACKGFGTALFPVGNKDLEMFPVTAGQTGLVDAGSIVTDPILSRATTGANGQGTPLVQLAMTAKPFAKEGQPGSAISVGDSGPRMNSDRGPLIWRLAQGRPNFDPTVEDLKSAPELLKKVQDDYVIREAFAKAVKKANEIELLAKTNGLDAVATANKLKSRDTGFFARKRVVSLQNEALNMARQQIKMELDFGQITQEQAQAQMMRAYLQAMQYPPLLFVWNEFPGLAMPQQWDTERQKLIEAAFALVPANPEPPYKHELAIKSVEVKPLRLVAIMERVDYRPAVTAEFQQQTSEIAQGLQAVQDYQVRQQWFAVDQIEKRVNFQKEEGR